MTKRNIFALYGGIGIMKKYCEDCKRYAFIIDGRYQCCDKKDKEGNTDDFIIMREVAAEGKRRSLSKGKKGAILELQDYQCVYCGCDLHSCEVHFDHFIPFSFCGSNSYGNFVATCADCNLAKSDLMFDDIRAVKKFLKK